MNTQEHFEQFWKHYPRKVGKKKALEKYKSALKKIGAEGRGGVLFLLDRVTLFEKCVSEWPQFDPKNGTRLKPDMIPHPTTWLNEGRYDDDPSDWRRHSQTEAARLQRAVDKKVEEDARKRAEEAEALATAEEKRAMFAEWRKRNREQSA